MGESRLTAMRHSIWKEATMSRERRASPEAPGAGARTRATFTVSAHPICSRLSPSQNMWHCSLSCRRLHRTGKVSTESSGEP